MHTTKPTTPSDPSESEAQSTQTTDGRPQGGPYFDWIIVALSAWWLGGLYLDGWAHRHVPALETFFTPWHAVLYSGFAACALALLVTQARNMRHGYPWRQVTARWLWPLARRLRHLPGRRRTRPALAHTLRDRAQRRGAAQPDTSPAGDWWRSAGERTVARHMASTTDRH